MSTSTIRDWEKSQDPAWKHVHFIEDLFRPRAGGYNPHMLLGYINDVIDRRRKRTDILDAVYKVVPPPIPSMPPCGRHSDFATQFKAQQFDAVRALLYPPPYVQTEDGQVYMPEAGRHFHEDAPPHVRAERLEARKRQLEQEST